ncbi:MAG: cytidine deaminase [Thiobacillaceae bacterium]|jgi:cytidine deaminase|nr:cytidine deaminase [Thiobacillaceae bacterium]
MTETTPDQLDPSLRRLIEAAREAADHAYSPYSGLSVGAALLGADGSVVSGANVENAAYPLGICAERTAIAAAVSQGLKDFRAIAVTARGSALATDGLLSPCGACRQTLIEFAQLAGHDIQVLLASPDGQRVLLTSARELLPLAMGRDQVRPGA